MSEWFKEHDWKSCVRLKRTGGSNPLLCANKKTPHRGCFFVGMGYGNRRGFEGGSREREWAFCLRIFQNEIDGGQNGQLIIVQRGAPLKARILFSAPKNRQVSTRNLSIFIQAKRLGWHHGLPCMELPIGVCHLLAWFHTILTNWFHTATADYIQGSALIVALRANGLTFLIVISY